jgi:hypothetical protein
MRLHTKGPGQIQQGLAIKSISARRSGCRIGKAANLRRKATIASIGTATP